MTAEVQRLAVATFQALGCSGVARVDFLNDKETGGLWVNEINTIPGSLAFYLWEAAGTSFTALLDEMLSLAFKRAREREALTFKMCIRDRIHIMQKNWDSRPSLFWLTNLREFFWI